MRAIGADVEAHVAAADFAAALDEHDAELAVAVEAAPRHHPVARLEHVQRQHRVREQHRSEREHRHRREVAIVSSTARAAGAPRPQRRGERLRARAATSSYARSTALGSPRRARVDGATRPAARSARRESRGAARTHVARLRGHRPTGRARGWRASRARIARGGVGARSLVCERAHRHRSRPRTAARQPARSSRTRRRGTGRTTRSGVAASCDDEVAGHPDPAAPRSPRRRATSISSTDNVIGMPRRRSMTASRNELRGSP